MSDQNSPATPDSEPVRPAPPRRRARWLLAGTLALPVLASVAGLGAYWALGSAGGSAWLLRQVPGLVVEAPEGALLGDFSARRLAWRSESFSLELQGLAWQGLSLSWDRSPALWGRLRIQSLSAQRLLLDWKSDPDAPPTPAPQDLALPLALDLPALSLGEISAPGLGSTPLRELRAGLWLSEDGGARHRLALQGLRWERLNLEGEARIASAGPLPLQAALRLSQQTATESAADLQPPAWRAQLQLDGPLAAPQLQAEAQVQVEGQTGQRLQLQAGLRPFAPWPLAGAEIKTQNFDLQALSDKLPATALSGSARLDSPAWDQPALLQAELSNARAGRWDQRRLPLQQLKLDLALRPDRLGDLLSDPQGLAALQLRRLEARLGSAAEPGGELTASGTGVQLQARLRELRSAALDARLPRLTLGGSLALEGQPGTPGLPLRLQSRLEGQFMPEGAPARPLSLVLQARHADRVLELEDAQLQSGHSQLRLQGRLQSAGSGAWSARFQAAAKDFDPRLLWAGPPRSAWAQGQHSLEASASGELTGVAGGSKTWPQGRAELKLGPSLLAGIGLEGTLNYLAEARGNPALRGELRAGENRLQLRAEDLGGKAPQGQLSLDAPRLAPLAPLLALAGGQPQLAGSLQAQADFTEQAGAWRSSGSLKAQGLQLRGLPALGQQAFALAESQLGWSLDSRAEAPLRAEGRIDRLSLGSTQLSSASLDLQGSWARHRLQLQAQGQLPAPSWAAGLVDGNTLGGQFSTELSGQLSDSPWQALVQARKPLDWRAQVGSLLLRPQPQRRNQPDWLRLQDLTLSLSLGGDGLPIAAQAQPGRLELAGATLSWSQLQWQAPRQAGQNPLLALDLNLEPLKVAPLLARWQPDFGWGGELVVGGKVHVRSSPQVEIDIGLSRAGGDLTVTEGSLTQQLGLSDLHISLQARDGIWHFAQGLAGSNLGVLAGAASARTTPQALWPEPQAPLEGVLQLDVANLSTWGAWVPAGWRLGGTFNAALRLAGKVGAPELLGSARAAQLQLRNPLLGVDAREGELALDLQGPSATLQRFSVRGGEGTLSAQGRAELGAKPQLDLSFKAEKFAFLSRVDRRVVASGQAALLAGDRSLSLKGQVAVDEGLFDFSRGNAPSLDSDVQVLRRPDPQAQAAASTRRGNPNPPKIDVQVGIDLGRDLRLRGRGVDTRLRGELRLIHQGAGPLLTGTVRTFGGTYDAYGQKLEIEKGEVSFAGAIDNPRLDVRAVRPNTDQVVVGVTVTGTALDPRIKLFSEPDKSDTEKLSWLLLGRAPDNLGRTDTALLQRAALALLSGEGESPSGKLMKNLGLDEFSLGQDDTDARSTVVRLGKQLSRRWYVGYERSLNATAGSWQLIYRMAQRFTLRAQAGQDNALDLIWQWKWD